MKNAVVTIALVLVVLSFQACPSDGMPPNVVRRENLFTLPLGKMEDQIDLFQADGPGYARKTRVTMRDGLVYIGSGIAGKVTEFSSYGDLLSMLYNPETNPEPVILTPATPENAETPGLRKAIAYPFIAPGEIAVSQNQQIFVEDILPPERKVIDEESNILLETIVLRFSPSGEYIDFLGQEGIGGTPFPYISGLYVTSRREIVVVTMTERSWDVFWFSEQCNLLYTIKIKRDALPLVDKDDAIPTLERIVPDMDQHLLYMKLDYFKESFDPKANVHAGIEYSSSRIWVLDPKDASFKGNFQVPSVEKADEEADGNRKYQRIYELIGATKGRNLYFMMPEDDNRYVILIMNADDKSIKRAVLEVSDEEMQYNSFFLSETGILCALFATQFEARLVWWRLDKLVGEGVK